MSLYSLIKTALLGILIVSFTGSTNSYAQSRGGANGGGGDATEMGVDSIRANILKWIETGRSIRFKKYPVGINNATYVKRMKAVLAPHQVVVGFVTTAQENQTQNPEQKVFVAGNAKSCRGFVSTQDSKPHILCNSDRYPKDADEQYKLIHHEFAGLAGVEKNIGPSSDYTLSNQISDNLVSKVVRALPINKDEDALRGLQDSVSTPGGGGPFAIARKIECFGTNVKVSLSYSLSRPDGMNIDEAVIRDGGQVIEGPFVSNEYFISSGRDEHGASSMAYPSQFVAYYYGSLYRINVPNFETGKNKLGTMVIEKHRTSEVPENVIKKLSCNIEEY